MTTVEIILVKWKVMSKGTHPIMLRITKFRKIKYFSLKKACLPIYWDDRKNLPNAKHPSYKELTRFLENRKKELEKLVDSLEAENPNISAEEIRNKFSIDQKKGGQGILNYFGVVTDRLKAAGRIGYAEVFQHSKNSLNEFLNGKDIKFTDINGAFLYRYEIHLQSRNVMPNTVFLYLRTFKTLINYAKKELIVRPEYDPFKDFSLAKYRNIKTRKRAILKDDIASIKNLNLIPGSSLYHSRNIFLFSYYCRGINFIDIAHLKWHDVETGRLKYERKKTKDLFDIALLPPAMEILEYYHSSENYDPQGYIFPVLNIYKHQTPVSISNRIHKMLRRTNTDLKKIGEKAEIKGCILTTYVARHAYAMTLKTSGISQTLIKELLGHVDEKTTQVYLESFGNDILDNADLQLL